jgi:signal transduction histidine kinase
VDALVIVPLALFCLLLATAYGEPAASGQATIGMWGALGLTAALMTPLFWRRRHPLAVFAITAGVSFLQWLAGVDVLTANMAVLVAMYGVASRRTLRWALAAGAVVELGVLLSLLREDAPFELFPSASVFVITIWITGIYVNTRRRYVESLVERAERAELERDQQARIATAAERVRIARELHDVVAHNVSVMVVQADGAGFAIDSDPDQARRAVRIISTTGRQAMAEMRRLVGVLREDAGTEERYSPQPGVAQLGDLVEQVRASGLPTDLTVSGTPRDLPAGEQLVIYRIVQEALTNTLKHGGPRARATVDVVYGDHEIELKVTDDGRGASAPWAHGGHGLIGMRERVAMYGGSVDAAARVGGGFLVVARLPVSRAA